MIQTSQGELFRRLGYYGWYSNKSRGMRNKAAAEPSAEPLSRPPLRGGARDTPVPPARGCSQTWAMLIKRVYEIDPLACPRCGGQMKVVAFIEPPQREVIEKILRGHQSAAMVGGLWHASTPRAPPAGDGSVPDLDGDSDPLTCWIHQLPLVRLSPVGKTKFLSPPSPSPELLTAEFQATICAVSWASRL